VLLAAIQTVAVDERLHRVHRIGRQIAQSSPED
jgi:hypothetical protein